METKRRLTDDEFKYIYSRVPRLCVDIIIKTPDGILLTLRDIEPYKNFWHIPGGTIYLDETVDGAAKRVAKKELGIEIDTTNLAGYAEYPSEKKARGWGWTISLQIFCTIKPGEFELNKQAKDKRFFRKFEEIPENIIEEHLPLLKKILI